MAGSPELPLKCGRISVAVFFFSLADEHIHLAHCGEGVGVWVRRYQNYRQGQLHQYRTSKSGGKHSWDELDEFSDVVNTP
jgi:hypothetical protein